MLGRYRDPVWRAIVFAFALVEVPLFLIRNRELFRNDILYPFWHWSFGHTVSGIDYASRLYWPHRISLLYVPHPNANPLLPRLFEHNVDTFTYRSAISFKSVNIDAPRVAVLRFFTFLAAALVPRLQVAERESVYRTMSLAAGARIEAGDPDANELVEALDYTGYVRLLHDGVGRDASLPADLRERTRAAIAAAYPDFFTRPFVTLTFRRKGKGLEAHTAIRDAGPAESYVPAVRWLTENGFHVVLWGDDAPALTAIDGVHTLERAQVPRDELNLFVFAEAALFVGQQSGAPVLANACGVPCVLVDALPHRYGTFRRDDLVLFKRLRERDGRVLSLAEIYRDHPDLAQGYNYESKGVEIVENTPDEILEAVKEAAALARGELELSEEDERLAAAFRALPTPSMPIAYHANRPPLFELRALRDELEVLAGSRP
ncbi:MAG: TIGR04372 family glycosyltransferase [Actinomycetota bacterium]|nr:TIGR04372 family glycosyltransferase [Actinomycetota bacterium]